MNPQMMHLHPGSLPVLFVFFALVLKQAPVQITHLNANTLTFLDLEQKFSLAWDGVEGAEGYWITAVATPKPQSPYSDRLVNFQEPAIVDSQLEWDCSQPFQRIRCSYM